MEAKGEQKNEKENEGNKRVTMKLVVVERDLREPLVDNKPTTCEDNGQVTTQSDDSSP